jgi:hypothetical protein
MAQSFCQRVRRWSTGQWSHILKKPLKGCKAPINETHIDQNRTAMRILWTEVQEGGVGTSSKILLWYVSAHKKVGHYIRQIDDSPERLNRRTPAISDHHPGTGVAAQQDGEQALVCPEVHKGRMRIAPPRRDQKRGSAVVQLLLEARCNIDLQTKGRETVLQVAQRVRHAGIATLIRNTKQKGAKDVLLQASPEKIK